jgi:hypothetical protein
MNESIDHRVLRLVVATNCCTGSDCHSLELYCIINSSPTFSVLIWWRGFFDHLLSIALLNLTHDYDDGTKAEAARAILWWIECQRSHGDLETKYSAQQGFRF